METDKEDVRTESYRDEKKNWAKTSEEPEAYVRGVSWGLARLEDEWVLFVILSTKLMKEVDRCEAKNSEPPFLWARGLLIDLEKKRQSATWDERLIGKRKPGEEGYHGGTPIPMQTFDAKKKAEDARRKPPGTV